MLAILCSGSAGTLPNSSQIFAKRSRATNLLTPSLYQQMIDQLNRDFDFGNLREVLIGADAELFAALIEPVLDHFAKMLDAVAAERSDLDLKCGALLATLKNVLAPPNPEMPYEFLDDDLPF